MIAIIDYEMGNLRSVQKALERVGGDARIVQSAAELAGAEKIVLPGVGAFCDAMEHLRRFGLIEPIKAAIAEDRPFLGICLGLQLLFEVSFEDGRHEGLGVLAGSVEKFEFDKSECSQKMSIPHMGWNGIDWDGECQFLEGITRGEYFYFCHSYYVSPAADGQTCTTTDYGGNFTSSIRRGNLFATQFHPEKSQSAGLKMLENFVRM